MFFGSASLAEIRHLGHWNKQAVNKSYLLKVATKPLLVAAGYDTRLNSYILPRSRVTPPTSLTELVMPWVAEDLRQVEILCKNKNDKIHDHSAKNFLENLMWLKVVFLQDMAIMRQQFPDLPICDHPVFKSPEWALFAQEVQEIVAANAVRGCKKIIMCFQLNCRQIIYHYRIINT